MPSWSPNWNDVRWDWYAAARAIQALQNAANKLDQSADQRQSLASAAQREWRGRYREDFDVELARMVRQAREIAAECRAAANRIANASHAAREEQQHRERERERWRREKADEERRERERRERERRERRERRRHSGGGGGGGGAG